VAARLEEEEAPQVVEALTGVAAPVEDSRARDRRVAGADDAHGLAPVCISVVSIVIAPTGR
jgi:hypothetical protein